MEIALSNMELVSLRDAVMMIFFLNKKWKKWRKEKENSGYEYNVI